MQVTPCHSPGCRGAASLDGELVQGNVLGFKVGPLAILQMVYCAGHGEHHGNGDYSAENSCWDFQMDLEALRVQGTPRV